MVQGVGRWSLEGFGGLWSREFLRKVVGLLCVGSDGWRVKCWVELGVERGTEMVVVWVKLGEECWVVRVEMEALVSVG